MAASSDLEDWTVHSGSAWHHGCDSVSSQGARAVSWIRGSGWRRLYGKGRNYECFFCKEPVPEEIMDVLRLHWIDTPEPDHPHGVAKTTSTGPR